jgi:autotransporter passenger strand-loop-strand repeat protein
VSSGGFEVVSGGGTAIGTVVSSSGAIWKSTARRAARSWFGGAEDVFFGAIASDTVVSIGGHHTSLADGCRHVVVGAGFEIVSSGGTATARPSPIAAPNR